MNRTCGRFSFPEELSSFIAKIAELYSPSNAIDPWGQDIAVLQKCRFVKDRLAIFPDPASLSEASDKADMIRLELGNISELVSEAKYDLVTASLPLGVRDLVDGRARHLDLVIAERCLDFVSVNGVCLLVVPTNFLSASIYKPFRDRVIEKMALDAVIDLGSDVVTQSLLVIRAGDPRRFGTFLAEYRTGEEETLMTVLRTGTGSFFVMADALRGRWDRRYHDPRHHRVMEELSKIEARRLGEMGKIRRSRFLPKEKYQDHGEFLVLNSVHLRQGKICPSNRNRFVDRHSAPWFQDAIMQPGDVVVSLVGPAVYVFKETDPPAVLGLNCAVIRSEDGAYLSTYLNTPDGQALFVAQADRHSRGTQIRQLSISDLSDFLIPILPLANLNSVSDSAIEAADRLELERLRQELASIKVDQAFKTGLVHDLQLRFADSQEQLEIAKRELGVAKADSAIDRQRVASYGEMVKGLNLLVNRTEKIEEVLHQVNAKTDHIIDVLAGIRSDIAAIKNSSRNDEEKLTRICSKLDAFSKVGGKDTGSIKEYVEIVQAWLERWDALSDLTKKFLPSAEQIYDMLERQASADTDFSPFVIQYCRGFENEILTKLFDAYHDDFNDRVKDRRSFVDNDLEPKKKTSKFANCILRDKRKYPLGDMNFILQLLKFGGGTLASSPLLQDFRKFVLRYFDQRVAEKEFLDKVDRINESFRKKAAHPYLIDKATADECLAAVRAAVSEFLNCYQADRK